MAAWCLGEVRSSASVDRAPALEEAAEFSTLLLAPVALVSGGLQQFGSA